MTAAAEHSNGAIAGGVAAAVWAAQQPLDKRVFGCDYDDVELLGKARHPRAALAGRRHRPARAERDGLRRGLRRAAPAAARPAGRLGLAAAMAEHVALWPLGRFVDRYHPARGELTPLGRQRRAFAQAAWRHALFGAGLGVSRRA